MPSDEDLQQLFNLIKFNRVYITSDYSKPGIVTEDIIISMIDELSPYPLTHFYGPRGTYFPSLVNNICYVSIPEEQYKRLLAWMNSIGVTLQYVKHKYIVFGVSKEEDQSLNTINHWKYISAGSV